MPAAGPTDPEYACLPRHSATRACTGHLNVPSRRPHPLGRHRFPAFEREAPGYARPVRSSLALLAAAGLLAGCGGQQREADWTSPNADLAGTRVAVGSEIDAGNVASLRVAWRFRYPAEAGFSGIAASTPLVRDGRVYVQDLRSNVYALDAESGDLRWSRRFDVENGGPNGLALDGDTVYGNTTTAAFALAAANGSVRWLTPLGSPPGTPVTIAPAVADGTVYTATTAQRPGGRGELVALDAETGAVRWRFDTIEEPWRFPEAFGGGAWGTPTVDEDGRVYWGTANPNPWGGTDERPNGGSYPGPARYTSSLVVLGADDGRLAWFDQVTPHDIRDYDFQNPPVLVDDLVVGGGKAGRVIAWNRASGARVWETEVGLHRNDRGPLPPRRIQVCPGFLGGVETPLAVADGRIFVPVVDRCYPESDRGSGNLGFYQVEPADGTGRLSALDLETGRLLWERRLPQPVFGCATVSNDLVLTSTYDGTIYAFDAETGTTVWKTRAQAGINACPAVAGDLLLVQAGTDHPSLQELPELALVAYRLPR